MSGDVKPRGKDASSSDDEQLMPFQVGKVFYSVSLADIGKVKILYVTHFYLDAISEDGTDLRFRELVRLESEWRISPTDTVFGEGTKDDVFNFLVTKEGLPAKIKEVLGTMS